MSRRRKIIIVSTASETTRMWESTDWPTLTADEVAVAYDMEAPEPEDELDPEADGIAAEAAEKILALTAQEG